LTGCSDLHQHAYLRYGNTSACQQAILTTSKKYSTIVHMYPAIFLEGSDKLKRQRLSSFVLRETRTSQERKSKRKLDRGQPESYRRLLDLSPMPQALTVPFPCAKCHLCDAKLRSSDMILPCSHRYHVEVDTFLNFNQSGSFL
jgi:hypothetical protein